MNKSFRQIAEVMNPRRQKDTLKKLYKEHRFVDDKSNFSWKNISHRHNNSSTRISKIIFLNAFLLRAPGNDAPAIPYRAALLGEEFKESGYDIAFLSEVFEKNDAELIKNNGHYRNMIFGPGPSFPNNSSGLCTLSNERIKNKNIKVFENDGGMGVADAWSQKGVLHTEIDMGPGNIDFYSTHLIYGTTFPFNNPIPESERLSLRLKQIEELTKFIKETHKKKNIIVLCGDFNINANDENAYRKMVRKLFYSSLKDGSRMKLDDLWRMKGGSNGATNNPYTKCIERYNQEGIYCEDDNESLSGRIDYFFVERPKPHHDFNLDITVMRRRPLPVKNIENINDALDLLEQSGTEEFVDEIKKRVDIDVDNIFKFSTPRDAYKILNRHIDIRQLLNNWLRRECKRHNEDRIGHLSDHIGLETTFIASSK